MTCPDRLYKYTTFDTRSFEQILDSKIYYSDPLNFNDPFEFQPEIVMSNDMFRDIGLLYTLISRNQFKKNADFHKENYPPSIEMDTFATEMIANHRFNRTYSPEKLKEMIAIELKQYLNCGVLSLSATKESSLMWSHYADEHRGVCLGYSIPQDTIDNIYKIDYTGNRLVSTNDIFIMLNRDVPALERVKRSSLMTKSDCWEYEYEYRLFEESPGVKDFAPELQEIIFGLRMKKSVQTAIINAIKYSDNERLSGVKFFNMVMVNPGGFDLYPLPINV